MLTDRCCRVPLAAAMLMLFLGCSKSVRLVPAAGRVEQGGKPVANAMVLFMPDIKKNPEAKIASARTDDSGAFRLQTPPHGEGATPGTYRVTVSGFIGKKQIADKYSRPDKSQLTVDIPEGGKQDIVLKID